MDVLKTRCVDVKMLGSEWWRRMVDVCGVGTFRREKRREVFITHLHLDHMPLKEYIAGAKVRFYVAPAYLTDVMKAYGDSFEVCEYRDIIETAHTALYNQKYVKVKTFGYFFGDELVIPECDGPDDLIKEYSLKTAFIFVAHQSHNHPVSFNNRRRDVFIIDNSTWKPYAPNVIPKIVFSSAPSDAELYRKHFRHYQNR